MAQIIRRHVRLMFTGNARDRGRSLSHLRVRVRNFSQFFHRAVWLFLNQESRIKKHNHASQQCARVGQNERAQLRSVEIARRRDQPAESDHNRLDHVSLLRRSVSTHV